ncbi:MAG: glycogen-binding domain-containing protein [Proteobacteria bacterium]|nr:glycogen-binding domain-containing protein [Pseudomonadota bacterium]MBU1738112.1 glycogen-binding domain-containing protein [Pseudomonadota bacterium]
MTAATNKKASPKTAAKKSVAKSTPSTEFAVFAPDAREIFLVGDFVDWNIGKHKMKKSKTGHWTKKVQLKPGRYEYLFVIDGNWQCDPENNNRQANPFGSENSVLVVS